MGGHPTRTRPARPKRRQSRKTAIRAGSRIDDPALDPRLRPPHLGMTEAESTSSTPRVHHAEVTLTSTSSTANATLTSTFLPSAGPTKGCSVEGDTGRPGSSTTTGWMATCGRATGCGRARGRRHDELVRRPPHDRRDARAVRPPGARHREGHADVRHLRGRPWRLAGGRSAGERRRRGVDRVRPARLLGPATFVVGQGISAAQRREQSMQTCHGCHAADTFPSNTPGWITPT